MGYESVMTPEKCTGMDDVRQEIDRIDREVISLLGKRYQYVLAAAAFKTSATAVRAPERFETMLRQRREWAAEEALEPDVIEKLYRDLVTHFIEKEMRHWETRGQLAGDSV